MENEARFDIAHTVMRKVLKKDGELTGRQWKVLWGRTSKAWPTDIAFELLEEPGGRKITFPLDFTYIDDWPAIYDMGPKSTMEYEEQLIDKAYSDFVRYLEGDPHHE